MSNRDVLITGMGLISSLGKDVDENWTRLKKCETGIGYFPREDLPPYMQYMGEISDYQLPDNISPKQRGQLRFLNRAARFGLSSVNEALPLETTRIDHV